MTPSTSPNPFDDLRFMLTEMFDQIKGIREDLNSNFVRKPELTAVQEDVKELKDHNNNALTRTLAIGSFIVLLLNLAIAFHFIHP